jgi:hypothetical protein
VGALELADGYRVTGLFGQPHRGAYVDGYLAAAIPFLMVLVFRSAGPFRVAGALLMVAATYALMVTFSRGGYVSFGWSWPSCCWPRSLRQTICSRRGNGCRHGRRHRADCHAVFNGFSRRGSQQPVPTWLSDKRIGKTPSHPRRRLVTSLFGAGLGRSLKPNTGAAPHPKVGTYQLKADAANTYLRLDSATRSVWINLWR